MGKALKDVDKYDNDNINNHTDLTMDDIIITNYAFMSWAKLLYNQPDIDEHYSYLHELDLAKMPKFTVIEVDRKQPFKIWDTMNFHMAAQDTRRNTIKSW